MKVLLIAYEFPPIIAAQSIRWFYIANGLAELGIELHVLCPEMSAMPDFPGGLHDKIVLHRVWPGPFTGIVQELKRRRLTQSKPLPAVADAQPLARVETSLLPSLRNSFASRISIWLRRVLNVLIFPDLRTEWYPFARRKLSVLIAQHEFDAVISSHEPGVDILLGLFARKKSGAKWIIDLADPILAPYTPRWRHKADFAFEGYALKQADRVVLTNEHVQDLLRSRHHITDPQKFICVPQGFSVQSATASRTVDVLPAGSMNIVFTGTFYSNFRSPEIFSRAMRRLSASDVSLTIVGDNAAFKKIFYGIPNVRFIGKIDHFACVELQHQADVLLNIGNLQAYQLPGKIYEYLGAAKPVLHIKTGKDDPGAQLIQTVKAGVVVENTEDAIADALSILRNDWRNGKLQNSFCADRVAIECYSWEHRALAYRDILCG